jgi:hypothetical protein
MSELNPGQASQEIDRLVLQMDAAISAFRAGQSSGVQALDVASQIVRDGSNNITTAGGVGLTPRRPDRGELAVLTVLADTYGSEMMTNSSLGYVLRLFAKYGGVALVQRVLFGESAADQQLAVMLSAARVAFTQVSEIFVEEFFGDANAVIARFRPRPPTGFRIQDIGLDE